MIHTWSEGPANLGMPETILLETIEKVRRHPWWKARASLAVGLLARHRVVPPARVADVGCGWGTNLDLLEERGYRATGLDISRPALEMIDRPNRTLVVADLNQEFPREARGSYDACLVLDVIEHLENDQAALARIAQLLVAKGICIVSVPALPQLFSVFDKIQGHRRRYLPESLRVAFRETGLNVQSMFWWGLWMVPVLRLARRNNEGDTNPARYAEFLRLPMWPGPQLMALAHAIEKPLAMNGWLPKGTSLFAVAQRL